MLPGRASLSLNASSKGILIAGEYLEPGDAKTGIIRKIQDYLFYLSLSAMATRPALLIYNAISSSCHPGFLRGARNIKL